MNLWDYIATHAWALDESAYERLTSTFRGDGVIDALEASAARMLVSGEPKRPSFSRQGGIAVVSVSGMLSQHHQRYHSYFGISSYEAITTQLRAAVEDAQVAGIFLDIDSPGGAVAGVADLADEIYALRDKMPIVAYSGGEALSAGYWLASQASSFVLGQSAVAGSIGVVRELFDGNRGLRNEGIDRIVVKSGAAKHRDSVTGGMTEALVADIQRTVEGHRDHFVAAVMRGRDIDKSTLDPLSDGSVRMGTAAVEAKLADRIGTRADALTLLGEQIEETPAASRVNAGSTYASHGGSMADQDPSVPAPAADDQQVQTPPAPEQPRAATPESDPIAQERERTSRILAAASPDQRELAQALIAGGTDLASSLESLQRDASTRRATDLAAMRAGNQPIGPDETVIDPPTDEQPQEQALADMTPEEQFEASSYLRDVYVKQEWWASTVARGGDAPVREIEKAQALLSGGNA